MEWTQISEKWTAMTLRLRADTAHPRRPQPDAVAGGGGADGAAAARGNGSGGHDHSQMSHQ